MERLEIRRAAPEDAAALLVYLNRIGGESDNLLFGADGFKNSSIEEETAHIVAANSGRNLFLVGLDCNEIISTAMLSTFTRERVSHRATVALSVRRDHWHMGIGTAMLHSLVEHARENGVTVLELTVRKDNVHAIELYQKLGFRQIGVYEKEVLIDGVYYDALLMNLYL